MCSSTTQSFCLSVSFPLSWFWFWFWSLWLALDEDGRWMLRYQAPRLSLKGSCGPTLNLSWITAAANTAWLQARSRRVLARVSLLSSSRCKRRGRSVCPLPTTRSKACSASAAALLRLDVASELVAAVEVAGTAGVEREEEQEDTDDDEHDSLASGLIWASSRVLLLLLLHSAPISSPLLLLHSAPMFSLLRTLILLQSASISSFELLLLLQQLSLTLSLLIQPLLCSSMAALRKTKIRRTASNASISAASCASVSSSFCFKRFSSSVATTSPAAATAADAAAFADSVVSFGGGGQVCSAASSAGTVEKIISEPR
mmetsp:Transcript_10502/g.32322  ORF Transcript_10502/g.32322 Transcript_10502/m.32322 type:complete len:315 (-) Transcript_10502:349-1293(-)